MSMPLGDAAKIWSLNYRVLLSVISSVEPDITALGLDSKELFVLAEIDEHPYPAELAATLCMPKPTVTLYLKRLEAAGFLHRRSTPPICGVIVSSSRRPGVKQPKTASRSYRMLSASAWNASPGRSKRNSISCSNKSSDAAPVPVFLRIPIGGLAGVQHHRCHRLAVSENRCPNRHFH